ncbi:MAG: hypothetical protein WD738_02350 [Pirellulales bacterium]
MKALSRPGHDGANFEEIIRALNQIGYATRHPAKPCAGCPPLSVEWEDSGMDREHGGARGQRFRPQTRLRAQRRGVRRRVCGELSEQFRPH